MVFFPTRVRRSFLPVVAGVVWLISPGCATLHPPPAPPAQETEATTLKQTETLLAMVQQVGWKEVQDLLPGLGEQPDVDFPGVAGLATDLRTVEASTQTNHGVPPVDIGQLLDHNPNFWRAYYEISPGDPLMAMLHVGLLLAAGDAVRADRVATLAINFGRMDLAYRKELVRLDAHAQLVLQVSRGNAAELEQLRRTRAYATLEKRARAALAVWSKNPEARADLVLVQPAPAGAADPGLAELRQVDPLCAIPATVTGPEPAAMTEARRLWTLINDDKATGDDQVLARFSASAQAAGLDELALVAHSLLTSWHAGSRSLDEGFIHTSLQRLVSPDAAASICSQTFTEEREALGLGAETDAPPSNLEGVSVHPQLEQRLLVQIAATSYWIESGLTQGADLADNYGERGEAWAQLLQKDEAVADLRHSLQLAPINNAVRYSLAVTLSDSGDFKEADAVFAEAQKQAPGNALEVQAWGNHLFKQGRFAEAEAAYARAAKLDPGFAYARIMQHLARLRQGKPGGARPASKIEKEDPWGASLLGFLAGRIDEKTLFGRLEPQGGLRYSEEECELYFVLAQLALGRGDVAGARRNLHSCLGTGITSFVEYAMAWHELRRLNTANPPPPEKKSERGDMSDQEPV
jgi:lipoprotein NlpI